MFVPAFAMVPTMHGATLQMRINGWVARAALLGLLLVTGALRCDAQAVWQPAAGSIQLPLWPKGAPNARTGVGAETMRYAVDREGKQRLVGGKPWAYLENVTRPTITIYSPKKANSGAAVIVYPGGGYEILAIDLEGTEACDWLTSNGITCVLLKYRVPCQHVGAYRDCPPAHQDAQRAMSIVRFRAAEWRINPNKIGVLGFSAGGHMVMVSSTHFDKRLYPPVDKADTVSLRPDFALVLYPGHMAYRKSHFTPNPDIQVTKRTPPTFIVHAYDDPVDPVENSLVYIAALRKAGVPSEIHMYAKGGHAFGLRRTAPPATGWPQLAEAWLRSIGMIGR